MKRLALQRLVVWLAFAATLLVPLAAQASFLPACENREVASVPPPPDRTFVAEEGADPVAAACAAVVPDDAVGDSKFAAMCDARGASIVAPPRIYPVSDARIDVQRGCSVEHSSPIAGPGQRDGVPLDAPLAITDAAMLGVADVLPPVGSDLLPAYPPVAGAPRAGIQRGVDRPPR